MATMTRRCRIIQTAGITVLISTVVLGCGSRGGDVSLTGEAAQSSQQATVAVDFVSAMRESDLDAVARLATAELTERITQASSDGPGALNDMTAGMLERLPADHDALRAAITSVETHGDRAAVYFETGSDVWFIQLAEANGTWQVLGL